MENLISYIKNEKMKNEKDISNINEKISNHKYNIEKIESMIVELTKNIDTTYEIFSPNAYDKDYNVVEIEKLNLKKNELLLETDSLENEKRQLLENKSRIDCAYEEIFDIEKQLSNNVKNMQYLLEKERKNLSEKFSKETLKVLEYQINKQNHYLENDIRKQIDLIDNKISLCENFIDMDINRAKLEIIKLREENKNFENKILSEMFHVKHFLDSGKQSDLYEVIKEFINLYKKNIEMKIDFKYSGNLINDTYNNKVNVLRVLKEAIDNADKFSKGSIITITVAVDDFIADISENGIENINTNNVNTINDVNLNEININIENSNDNEISNITNISDNKNGFNETISNNNMDMHQINFVVDNTVNKYNITVKISDNGDGFSVQEDNLLVENNLYGIYMMRYRSKLINGTFDIQSEMGLGTTVTLVYQTMEE